MYILILIIICVIHKFVKPINTNIPTLWSLPVFGNILQILINMEREEDWLLELCKFYGYTYRWWIPFSPNYIVTIDPVNVKHILQSDIYKKSDSFREIFSELLGDGIFNSNDDIWKHQRKILLHMFSKKKMEQNIDLYINRGNELVSKLNPNKPINIYGLFHEYAFDCISDMCFGTDIDYDKYTLCKLFDECKTIICRRVRNPLWKLFPEKNSFELFDNIIYNIIKNHKQNNSLLSMLISKGITSDKFLRDIIVNFLFAGYDTIGQTLNWTFYLLSQNPTIEAELINEIANIEQINYEIVYRMNFCKAIINETLRLYPPVAKNVRIATEDDYLPNKIFVPKNSWVIYSPYVMGRTLNLWEDPTKFKPERFNNFEPNSFTYPVFNAGQRICIGKQTAYIICTLIMILILKKYKLKLANNQQIKKASNVTLYMKNGMTMIPTPINTLNLPNS